LLTKEDVESARQIIAGAQVLVCQLEIPLETTMAALRIAREEGVKSILNPAPAQPDLPDDIYPLCEIFCPNETETELLSGMPVTSIGEAEVAGRVLLEKGVGEVILTLGERGSLLITNEETRHVPVAPVNALDTTGAGDAFVGSLAHFLASGQELFDDMERANRIAAMSVLSSGTQTSFPEANDLPPDLID
jgi:ribokinase